MCDAGYHDSSVLEPMVDHGDVSLELEHDGFDGVVDDGQIILLPVPRVTNRKMSIGGQG